MGYIILITGASSGFGALTARALAKANHTVFAGFLSLEKEADALSELEEFNKDSNTKIQPVELDVTKDDACKAAVDRVLEQAGALDIVIHNAGHMSFGPLEAFTPEQLASMYEVNAIGTHRLNRAFLPYMRKQGRGTIIYVGSSSTRGATPPFLAPYFAAKAAMDALAVSTAVEVSRWGVETAIIVPGAFPTGTNHFGSAAQPHDKHIATEYEEGPYKGVADHINKAFEDMSPKDSPPDVNDVARAIVKVVDTPFGQRPFRTFIDPLDDGAEDVSRVADGKRANYYQSVGLDDLLHPASSKSD